MLNVYKNKVIQYYVFRIHTLQQKLNHLSKRILNSFGHIVSFLTTILNLIYTVKLKIMMKFLAIDITVEEIRATIIKFTVKILTILVFTKKVLVGF